MEWTGIRDNVTDVASVGDIGVSMLENGSLMVDGEFARRPGFGAKIAASGIVCAEIGAYVVFVTSLGDIVSEAQ